MATPVDVSSRIDVNTQRASAHDVVADAAGTSVGLPTLDDELVCAPELLAENPEAPEVVGKGAAVLVRAETEPSEVVGTDTDPFSLDEDDSEVDPRVLDVVDEVVVVLALAEDEEDSEIVRTDAELVGPDEDDLEELEGSAMGSAGTPVADADGICITACFVTVLSTLTVVFVT